MRRVMKRDGEERRGEKEEVKAVRNEMWRVTLKY